MTLAGATLTIAALAFIAGTLGAWLVYTDLRDSKRRFEARQRLGLGPYGDVIACDYTRAEAMQRIHSERLEKMVEANRASFRTQDYVKRREAALKHTRARA